MGDNTVAGGTGCERKARLQALHALAQRGRTADMLEMMGTHWWVVDEPKNRVLALNRMLAVATINDFPDTVHALLGAKASATAVSVLDMFHNGFADVYTPIMRAARWGSNGVLARLLTETNVDVSEGALTDSKAPLALAAGNGHVQTCRSLLQAKALVRGAAYCEYLLFYAVRLPRNVAVVGCLLKAGVVCVQSHEGAPLVEAVHQSFDNKAVAAALLAANVSVNTCDGRGHSPLLKACNRVPVRAGTVRLLLDAKAVPASGELTEAAVHGATDDVVRLLVGAKCDLEEIHYDPDWTPLAHAAFRGRLGTVAALVEAKANIQARDKIGRTLVGVACTLQGENASGAHAGNMVEWLVRAKVSVDARDNCGRTPMSRAIADQVRYRRRFSTNNHVDVVGALLRVKAEVDATTRRDKGQTPLAHAVRTGNMACARLLVAAKADLAVRDTRGRTLTDIAHRCVAQRCHSSRWHCCAHERRRDRGRLRAKLRRMFDDFFATAAAQNGDKGADDICSAGVNSSAGVYSADDIFSDEQTDDGDSTDYDAHDSLSEMSESSHSYASSDSSSDSDSDLLDSSDSGW